MSSSQSSQDAAELGSVWARQLSAAAARQAHLQATPAALCSPPFLSTVPRATSRLLRSITAVNRSHPAYTGFAGMQAAGAAAGAAGNGGAASSSGGGGGGRGSGSGSGKVQVSGGAHS